MTTPGQTGFATLPQPFVAGRLRLAGDRVAGVVRVSGSQRLALVDLRDTSAELSRFRVGDDLREAFDYDGARFAIAQERCEGVRIAVTDDLSSEPSSPSRCDLGLDRPPKLGRRSIGLDLSCAGRVIDCSLRIAVTRSGRTIAAGRSDVRGVAMLRMSRAVRARLRRGHRVTVVVAGQIPRRTTARLH